MLLCTTYVSVPNIFDVINVPILKVLGQFLRAIHALNQKKSLSKYKLELLHWVTNACCE